MKNNIIENIANPEILEKLYRDNKQEFCKSFEEIKDKYNSDLINFWKIRLASEMKPKEFSKTDLLAVIILSAFGGILIKLPEIFPQINLNFYYPRDLSIILFNGIILYTFWRNKDFDIKKLLGYGIAITGLTLFINLLPNNPDSDSISLSLIHTPLFLWCLFGLVFISFDYKSTIKKIEFIRFNGEFLIMTGLILIAGGILAGVTIGLFSVIEMNIESFYLDYVVLIGGVAAPIVSLYLVHTYPNITNKISPVIARVFTPLVLVTLAVYLVSLIFSNVRILDDRDFLILINLVLIAVMAIIVFSLTELDKSKVKNIHILVLFLLAVLAIVINAIASTAIITRLTYGLTPNRVVVLVSNALIFINLILIARNLFKSYFNAEQLESVEQTVAKYLTVYAVWVTIVIFVLPFLFGFN